MIIDLILIIINIMLNIIINYNKYSRQENLCCLRCKLSITWSDKFTNTAVLRQVDSQSIVFNGSTSNEWRPHTKRHHVQRVCHKETVQWATLYYVSKTLNRWEYLSDDGSSRRHTVQEGVTKDVKKGNKQLEAKRQSWRQRETFIRHSSFVCHAKLGLAKPL